MPKPVATILWERCRPREHEGERCRAAAACPRKVLRQEAQTEPPMPLGMCRGCGACVTACPLAAIALR
jgi:ferredoxin